MLDACRDAFAVRGARAFKLVYKDKDEIGVVGDGPLGLLRCACPFFLNFHRPLPIRPRVLISDMTGDPVIVPHKLMAYLNHTVYPTCSRRGEWKYHA